MAVPKLYFEMHAGDTKTLRFVVKDKKGDRVNLDNNLTAAIFSFYVSIDSTVAEFTKTLAASSIKVFAGAKGLLDVLLLPADTRTREGIFYVELELTGGAGEATAAFGNVKIIKALIS